MKDTHFREFVAHFVSQTRSTADHPVLLLLDNHESHLCIDTIDFGKDNEVVLLSFPLIVLSFKMALSVTHSA